MFVGVNNVARKISNCYVGIDGKARKVKAIYVGVNGVARLVWQSILKKLSSYQGDTLISSFTNSINHIDVQAIHKVSDTHILIGLKSDYYNGLKRSILMNCYLNNDGTVSKHSSFETGYESSSSFESIFYSISQFNESYGACISSVVSNNGSSSSARYLCSFNLDNSSNYTDKIQLGYISLNYSLPILKLNNNCIMVSTYNDSGVLNVTIFQCDSNGKISSKYTGILTNNLPSNYKLYGSIPSIFTISENRFATLFTVKSNSGSDNKTLVSIYSYSIDNSGNMTVVRDSYVLLNYLQVAGTITSIGDDYFILSSMARSIGLHIDSNNNVIITNLIETPGSINTQIGMSDSVLTLYGTSGSIVYYDKTNNTLNITWSGTLPYKYYKVSYKNDSILYAGVNGNNITLYKMNFI